MSEYFCGSQSMFMPILGDTSEGDTIRESSR